MVDARRAVARKACHFMRFALATASVLIVAPRFASAEVFDPLRGYGFDGTPIAPKSAPPSAPAAPNAPAEARPVRVYVSPATIRKMAARSGFKIIDQPYRRGRAFSATAEDSKGLRFRLIFNAFNGQIINQTALAVPDTKSAVPATAVAAMPETKPAESKPVVSNPAPIVAAVSPPEPYSAPTPVYTEMPQPTVVAATPPVVADTASPASQPAPVVASVSPPEPYSAPTPIYAEVPPPATVAATQVPLAEDPAKTVAAIPAAEVLPHAVPTPATPPVTYAAVNPCEIVAPAPALKSTALTPPPNASTAKDIPPVTATIEPELKAPEAVPDWTAANLNSPPDPYHAPAPVYGATPSDVAEAPSPMATGSLPKPDPRQKGPLEPPSAPTWSEVSGQSASAPKDEKP